MIFFKVIFAAILLWILGFCYFLKNITAESNQLSRADAIIVLTGAKGRIDAGLHLLQQKYADSLLISGVGQKADLDDLSQNLHHFPAKEMKKLELQISLGHFANSTEENATESLEWIKKNNFKKIILVTSNYHMPRSLYLFQKNIPDIYIIPYGISSNNNIKTIFIEYNKYLLAFIK